MKTKTYMFASVLSLLLLCANAALAQKQEPIRADWLAKDVALIERLLPQLNPTEPLTIAKLKTIFGDKFSETELGFGGRTFAFSGAGGYAYLQVSGFAFNGEIGSYKISLESYLFWPTVSGLLTDAWKRSSDLEFKQGKWGLYYDREIPNVLTDFKRGVSSQLGELQVAAVPADLNDAYEELVSVGNNSIVSPFECGFALVTPPGKKAIDALVKAERIDLIGNILKGYNPGGRVYAAVALIAMQRKGTELPQDLLRALEFVRAMDFEITTCQGCLMMPKKPKQIIADWPFEK